MLALGLALATTLFLLSLRVKYNALHLGSPHLVSMISVHSSNARCKISRWRTQMPLSETAQLLCKRMSSCLLMDLRWTGPSELL